MSANIPQITSKDELRQAIQSYFHGNPNAYDEIGNWDISAVTDMSNLFRNRSNNIPDVSINTPERNELVASITNWDMEHVDNMDYMFCLCSAFDQPLDWDVSNVTSMHGTFQDCTSFNQPLEWDTVSVDNMSSMFEGCEVLNEPIIFNTQNVTNMANMFAFCEVFNQPLDWDVRNVLDMSGMFKECGSLNQIITFNTKKVMDMSQMFMSCEAFNQELGFDLRNVRDASSMFEGCINFNQHVGTSMYSLENAESMFEDCMSFSQDLGYWSSYVNNLVEMNRMFYNCPNFPKESIVNWVCFQDPTKDVEIQDIFGPDNEQILLGIPRDLQRFSTIAAEPLQTENDPTILTKTIYDVIMLEDIPVPDYLEETKDDPAPEKHIVFIMGNNVMGVTRERLQTIIDTDEGSAIKYKCRAEGHALLITTDLIFPEIPYFSNKKIGLSGMSPLSQIKYIIEHPEITAVNLVESDTAIATSSYQMLTLHREAMSADHCQARSNETIYALVDVSPRAGAVGTTEGASAKGGRRKTKKRRATKTKKHRKSRSRSARKTRHVSRHRRASHK